MPFDPVPHERELDIYDRTEQILLARRDPNAFIEYVFRGEGGRRLLQEQGHIEWQKIWSQYERSVILGPIGCGKTTQARGRLIWEMGQDPEDTRIAYVSATQAHPKKQLGSIKEEIARNPRIWHVFPHLRRAEGEREEWSSTKILVQRESTHPDVTLECYGAYGSILGSRKTIIFFDDLCNFANTLTQNSREKMCDWLAEVLSRAKGRMRLWGIGHIWHEADALQYLRKKPGWYYARYEATRKVPDPTPEKPDRTKEVPVFPNVLPMLKIASLCVDLGPVYSEMMLWNRLPPATMSRFADEWFVRCLELGRGLAEKFRPEELDSRGKPRENVVSTDVGSAGTIDRWKRKGFVLGWLGAGRVFCAADLGHTKALGSDLTVLITAVVFSDGTRRILDVRAGRWKGDETARHLQTIRKLFDPKFFVESNGGQSIFIDLLEDAYAIPVTKSHTGMDKYDYQNGIEAIGTELRQGRWILPCTMDLEPPPEIAEMIKGAKGYSPDKHPSDYLMAWWILRKAIVQFDGDPPPEHDPQAGM